MDSRYHLSQDSQNWKLISVSVEKDLGVLFTSNLKVSHQCVQAACKASKVLRMIRRQVSGTRHSFMILTMDSFDHTWNALFRLGPRTCGRILIVLSKCSERQPN